MADVAVFGGGTGPSDSEDDLLLRALLADEAHRRDFASYCEEEHSEENIKFWEAIQEFKSAAEADAAGLAAAGGAGGDVGDGGDAAAHEARRVVGSRIIKKFVSTYAPLKVNMADSMRDELARLVRGDCPADTFDASEAMVFKQLKADTLKRYRLSGRYDAFVDRGLATADASQILAAASPMVDSADVVDLPDAQEQAELAALLRKRAFLGIKIGRSYSKSEKESFVRLGASIRATSIKAGFVMKRGDKVQTWTRRWFVISLSVLGYFLDEFQPAPKRVILNSEVTAIRRDEDEALGMRFTFALETKRRLYCFQAASDRDRDRWLEALEAVLNMTGAGALAAAEGAGDGGAPR